MLPVMKEIARMLISRACARGAARVGLRLSFCALLALAQSLAAIPMPQDPHVGHGAASPAKPDVPRLGKAQEKPGAALVTLAEVEQIALANNPTLRQAQAEVQTAQARQKQAGYYPNPSVGYAAEEVRGGSFGGGQHGFFVSQTIVTGGKLGLSRKIAGADVRIAEIEAEEQRLRVMNGVRISFYRTLAAQEMLELKRDQLRIADDRLRTLRQLKNTGQTDESELLAAEIEQQQAEMAVAAQEHTLRQAWRSLAAHTGNAALEQRVLSGSLEDSLPMVDEQAAVQKIAAESPAIRIAQASGDRSKALIARERREPIPDLDLRGGLQSNREVLNPPSYRAGLQGFAEVGIRIPLWNRNQGNIAAAQYQADRAQQEVHRVELVLRERATGVLDAYHMARIATERYREQILPRARKAYELMFGQYGTMTASYPQVLSTQRMLFQLQADYIVALERHWIAGLALQGLLLTDALEAPARPADVDLPVREVNIPAGTRMTRNP